MIAFACHACGLPFQVTPEHAGQKTKCPKCGTALVVPKSAPPPMPPVPVRAAPIPPTMPQPEPFDSAHLVEEEEKLPSLTTDARPRPPTALQPEPEPWYFSVIRIVAMTQAALVAVLSSIMGWATLQGISRGGTDAKLAIASFGMWVALALIGLLVPAAMFLALDMGTQLRAIRQRLDNPH